MILLDRRARILDESAPFEGAVIGRGKQLLKSDSLHEATKDAA